MSVLLCLNSHHPPSCDCLSPGSPVFRPVAAPGADALQSLVSQMAEQTGRCLEKCGLIERDIENAWLAIDAEAGSVDDLMGHPITHRLAVGPRAGRMLGKLDQGT